MPTEKTETPKAKPPAAEEIPVAEPTEENIQLAEDSNSQWEFINRVPSRDEVKALLETLPPWWGVHPVDYLDYIQALPSTKKVKVWQETKGKKLKVDTYFDVFTVYFSVAGRIQMLNEAQRLNGWRVDFVPEPDVPTFSGSKNPPGFLEPMNGKRLVYREYVQIDVPLSNLEVMRLSADRPKALTADDGKTAWFTGQEFARLGRRPGTAWVPREGGSQAAGSNPYEKVETSARGRAISAWGFGVLPGSGVASVEEMMGVSRNRAAIDAEDSSEPDAPKFDRKDYISDILTISEDIRVRSGQTDLEKLDRIAKYATKNFAVEMVATADPETGMPEDLDWSKLKDGQLQLMRNSVRQKLAELMVATEEKPKTSP